MDVSEILGDGGFKVELIVRCFLSRSLLQQERPLFDARNEVFAGSRRLAGRSQAKGLRGTFFP